MQRPALQRIVVWLAFAAALLVPLSARAAFIPACENREVASVMLPPPVEDDADALAAAACTAAVKHADDSVDDSKVAALCDPRGASMIAPPRIFPMTDARIDAPRKCGAELSSPMAGPAPDDSPASGGGQVLAEHAVIAMPEILPPAPSDDAPPFAAVPGAPRAGVKRGVDRPPC